VPRPRHRLGSRAARIRQGDRRVSGAPIPSRRPGGPDRGGAGAHLRSCREEGPWGARPQGGRDGEAPGQPGRDGRRP
jgi:hypothetical protein